MEIETQKVVEKVLGGLPSKFDHMEVTFEESQYLLSMSLKIL